MSNKRKQCEEVGSNKRARVEVIGMFTNVLLTKKVGTNPFEVDGTILTIASFLGGDDLKHFKMLNKRIFGLIGKEDCTLRITPKNMEQTCRTKGHHFMTHANALEILKKAEKEDIEYEDVEYLKIDHEHTKVELEHTLLDCLFPNLKELVIIRGETQIVLSIKSAFQMLEKLTIYTKGRIIVSFYRDLEQVKLYSEAAGESAYLIIKNRYLEDDRILMHGSNVGIMYKKGYYKDMEKRGFKIDNKIDGEYKPIPRENQFKGFVLEYI